MMPAAKHFDPLIGIDIHMIQPPGPVPPIPVPHPFIGMVIDPMEYAPFIGGTVKVNSMMRAVAGTGGKCLPPHIPIGGVFVKPPANEAEMFMGSATVDFDGDPASYMALPALSCHDIGMPSPPRMKKHTKPKSLELPTTVVLPIPAGPPVLIGGPPTINIMGMIMKVGMSALGKAFKKLKSSKLGKKFAAFLKKKKQNIFKNMKPGFLKCKVLKAEPVNSITGEVTVEQQDFSLPGPLPFEWNRTYGSQSERMGLCGYGWQTPADARLVFESDGSVTFADGGMGATSFPSLPTSGSIQEETDGAVLTNQAGLLTVRIKSGLTYFFAQRMPGATEVLVESVRDRRSNPLHFTRNGADLVSIADNSGRRIEVKCKLGRIAEMYLSHPSESQPRLLVRYEYNAAGDLVTVYDALNAPNRLVYKNHCLIKQTDRNALSFYWEYDEYTPKGKCIHPYGDGGLYDYRFEYVEILQETRVTDSLGKVTTIQYDERFLPVNEIDALGGVTTYEYDDAGRTVAVMDPLGNRTEYEYDERGNPLKRTRPDGSVVAVEYDDLDLAVKITDANGGIWEQSWDGRGLLTEQKSPLGAVSRFEFDSVGQLQTLIDPRGSRLSFTFDGFGDLRTLTDALGHRTEFTYDVLGNLARRIDPLGRISTYRHDNKSRLLEISFPSHAKIQCEYDSEDNLIRFVNESGAETRLEYRGLGKIAKRIQPGGFSVQYQYDTEERLVGITNQRGEKFRVARDALGRVTAEVDYWGQSRSYDYDAAGNVLAVIDPLGRQVNYKCDPVGRVILKLLPNGTEESFAYDANGNLIATENDHGAISREFDAEGRLIKETQGESFSLENRYDTAGNRVARVASSGNLVECAYDRANQVASMTINGGESLRVERDAAGQITRETLTTSVWRRFGYDPDGNRTEHAVSIAEGPLFSTRFEYDRAGNLTKHIDSQFGIDIYSYDPIGQIIEHIDPERRLTRFLNDPAGDRLRTRVEGPGVSSVSEKTGDGWRREGVYEGTLYRFDRAGNLVVQRDSERDVELVWDANQRLIESRDRGVSTYYGYDPLGRRLFKETRGVRTQFFWDGDALLGETLIDASQPDKAAPVREYVYYPGTFDPLALVVADATSRQVYHYHNDPNGCPTRMTDASGSVQWAAHFGPWGGVQRSAANVVANPIRLKGQYYDPETALHYNRFRYYSPHIGAFVSQDPLGIAAGANLYMFAVNVMMWTDPYGLDCSSDAAKLRQNLVAAGHVEPGYPNAAHHMVMSNSTDPRMIAARGHITTHGVDINDPSNGIFLPRGSADAVGTGLPPHSRLHTNEYKQAVHDKIMAATSPAEVQQALTDIRQGLIGGTFP